MAKIDAVTAGDVKELADELFQTNKLSLALIGPYSDEQAFRSIMQF
jgi:predicted Zn-dependent peptidase